MVRQQDQPGSGEPQPVGSAARGRGHLRADRIGQAVLFRHCQRASGGGRRGGDGGGDRGVQFEKGSAILGG